MPASWVDASRAMVRDLAYLFKTKPLPPTRDAVLEEILATIACKAAVKAGQKLSPEEIQALLAQDTSPPIRIIVRTAGPRRWCSPRTSSNASSAGHEPLRASSSNLHKSPCGPPARSVRAEILSDSQVYVIPAGPIRAWGGLPLQPTSLPFPPGFLKLNRPHTASAAMHYVEAERLPPCV